MQLRALQDLINAALATDPDVLDALRRYHGRTVQIILEGTGGALWLQPAGHGVALEWVADRLSPGEDTTDILSPAGDVVIRGAPSALLLLLASPNDGHTSIPAGMEVRGDLGLLDDLHRVVNKLSIDWEELLAQRFGDVAAHQLWRGLTSFREWTREAGGSLAQSTAEWLRYETGIAVSRDETHQFCREVDELRDHLARLEARAAHLVPRPSDPSRGGEDA